MTAASYPAKLIIEHCPYLVKGSNFCQKFHLTSHIPGRCKIRILIPYVKVYPLALIGQE